ncbi:MAG: rod-binding protein [Vampirovibrionales bacterium]|nr:rod-binding protein [Vampirovibrionales bacterium]
MQTNSITPEPSQNLNRFMLAQPGQQVGKLERELKTRENKEDLKKTAKQFEAIFVHQLLTEMDKGIQRDEDSIFSGGEAEKTFRGLMYQEIATMVADRPFEQGFGIAEAVYRQAESWLPDDVKQREGAQKAPSKPTEHSSTDQSAVF